MSLKELQINAMNFFFKKTLRLELVEMYASVVVKVFEIVVILSVELDKLRSVEITVVKTKIKRR